MMKLKIEIKPAVDRRRLRPGLDRRQFSYAACVPERRKGIDRRRQTDCFLSNPDSTLSICPETAIYQRDEAIMQGGQAWL